MTLKVQKNHYNVKLLRGYGVPINLKNNKIVLKGGSEFSTGNVQLADDTNSDRQFLKDRGNHKYVITMAAGDYVLGAHSAWYYKGNLTLSDGNVVFYYRISVTD